MAALCGKVILYYADMAKDVLLSYQGCNSINI